MRTYNHEGDITKELQAWESHSGTAGIGISGSVGFGVTPRESGNTRYDDIVHCTRYKIIHFTFYNNKT
nr:hypothetical protein [Tanacetum cinerariifolium]